MPDTAPYYVAAPHGLEEQTADELRELGASDVTTTSGGCRFQGDREVGYRVNLWSRCALRVQRLLHTGIASDEDAFYEAVRDFDWTKWIGPDRTFSIRAAVRDSWLRHSQYAVHRTKDAIVDRIRADTGTRPDVDVRDPDLPLQLVIRGDEFRIDLNLSGTSLHKRGWRPQLVKSPLNESLAASLLRASQWDRKSPLVDPMCGSGTFAIEAACLAADIAPGLGRPFAFERFPDHEPELWERLLQEAESRRKTTIEPKILASDAHGGAIEICRKSARAAGVESMVEIQNADVREATRPGSSGWIVTNPPYGKRLSSGVDLADSWRGLGNFLHDCPSGSIAHVLSGNRELTRHLGLRAESKQPVRNGPIDCRFLRYSIH